MRRNWNHWNGRVVALVIVCFSAVALVKGQDSPPEVKEAKSSASVGAEIGEDGSGKIIVEAKGVRPKVPVFFNASAKTVVRFDGEFLVHDVSLLLKVIQGKPETLTLGLNGSGDVVGVSGEGLTAWSVRSEGGKRFLDLRVEKEIKELKAKVELKSEELELPFTRELTHVSPGKAVGFQSVVELANSEEVDRRAVAFDGFLPVGDERDPSKFQTATGGTLRVKLAKSGALPPDVEFLNASLDGIVSEDGKSVTFSFKAKAVVSQPETSVDLFRGQIALFGIAEAGPYTLRLSQASGGPVYQLEFDEAGTYPVELSFSTAVGAVKEWKAVEFGIGAGTIVPISLVGVEVDSEFSGKDGVAMLYTEDGGFWQGFLPADGRARFVWKAARKTGEGKLFFTSTGKVESRIGAGLLRQDHHLSLRVLQGELESLQLELSGSGEVLDVSGNGVLAWEVSEDAEARTLAVKLSQPIEKSADFLIQTQSALGDFPVSVSPMRIQPQGVVRHSGHIRLVNEGSVRLTPAARSGLTQLSPDQFPGEARKARQVFVYRFPTGDYELEVNAERIQPEVNVSQVVIYRFGETDRVINANVELDVREAPVREWDLEIPADYSVVALSGASVADYVVGSEPANGRRSLKVLFGQDVSGRQLVSLHLEKSVAANAGDWTLPQITFAEAKSVRGDIGVAGAAGYRIGVGNTENLAEKPLSYFPNPVPNLQQAFRIREKDWSATMTVESLEKSVQADVFHLYSLNEGTAFASVVLNYFVTGAPVSEWTVKVPESAQNIILDGLDVRTWRQEEDAIIVTLHQPVIGPYTLLLSFEEKIGATGGSLAVGSVEPMGVQGERGFVQVVSPVLVKSEVKAASEGLLKLDPLELPAEFRLLTSFPSLGVYQYTDRPFDLSFDIQWFDAGTTTAQVIEFCDVKSRVSADGQVVTTVTYDVKSRGRQPLRLRLPNGVELWSVRAAGQSVTARQDGDVHLIPLPGTADPNSPLEIVVTLAKPGSVGEKTTLALPKMDSLILKTEWEISGGEDQTLVPVDGTVGPARRIVPPNGFHWIASSQRKFLLAAGLAGVFFLGSLLGRGRGILKGLSVLCMLGAVAISVLGVYVALTSPAPVASGLKMSLPVITPGEDARIVLKSVSDTVSGLSIPGLILAGLGLVGFLISFGADSGRRTGRQAVCVVLMSVGVLLQVDGAVFFYLLIGTVILLNFVVPNAVEVVKSSSGGGSNSSGGSQGDDIADGAGAAGAAGCIVFLGLMLGSPGNLEARSKVPPPLVPQGFIAADVIEQSMVVTDERVEGTGRFVITGEAGDKAILLKSPAVLNHFEGAGKLRVERTQVEGFGLCYVVHVLEENEGRVTLESDFSYSLNLENEAKSWPVATGIAASNIVLAEYEKPGWEFHSSAAMRIDPGAGEEVSRAALMLAPWAGAVIELKPKSRDVAVEETEFFVEGANLYTPGPGVVDGRHRVRIRVAQGEVSELAIKVPAGLTASEVDGPVGSWQFDAEAGLLKLVIEPVQSKVFDILVTTQRALDALPTEVSVSPLQVLDAKGEVGLIALAFGREAQPERIDPNGLSMVNAGDFDAALLKGSK
ncbi:MAG: hypothetical protein AAGA58_18275, partial [Verrucomicrobiota bacterium]